MVDKNNPNNRDFRYREVEKVLDFFSNLQMTSNTLCAKKPCLENSVVYNNYYYYNNIVQWPFGSNDFPDIVWLVIISHRPMRALI